MERKRIDQGYNLSGMNLPKVPEGQATDNSDAALRSRNDAYFHPLFAPYSQRSPQGIAKMTSYGFAPRRII